MKRRPSATLSSITHSFTIGAVQGYINVGLDENEQPFEIFLTLQKEGSTLGGFADAFARLLSTALQYEVPLIVICSRMQGLCFVPNGATSNPKIQLTESIVDYLAIWLTQTFLCPEKPHSIFKYVTPPETLPTSSPTSSQ